MLLVFAIAIVFAAEAIVEATRDGRINSHLLDRQHRPAGGRPHRPPGDPSGWRPTPTRCYCRSWLLLNGLGLVMIHRLDPRPEATVRRRHRAEVHRRRCADPDRVDGARPWVLFLVIIWFHPRPSRAGALRIHTGARGPCSSSCCHRCSRLGFSEVNGGPDLDPGGRVLDPNRVRFAKILLTIFASAYLVTKRGTCCPWPDGGFLGIGPAPRPRLRTAARGVADLHRASSCGGHDPRLLADVLRPVHRAALRGHRTGQLGHRGRAAVLRRRLPRLPAVLQRADACDGCGCTSSTTPTASACR